MRTEFGELRTLDISLPVFLPGDNRGWSEFVGVAKITENGEMYIAFQDDRAAQSLIKMAIDKILLQISIDYKMTAQMIKDLNERYTKKIISKVGTHPILLENVVVGVASTMTDGTIEVLLENDDQRYVIDTNKKADIT